ncbi:MAG: macrolide ABC transporter ATP-binding protein [Dehalococcoidia bacterium]|jgi:putative ABC transport system ATP-binding protein|nr:macrolide ABC transporter ATP-binding protein [Dehalococcoidia bacterium]HIN40735.1 ABC transporter ATP-binding protein [Flavobacteriales bacterium]|tara:strand:- start:1667 stop:2368 length:702 start_codon:yes stop_codon:yes gene_type:complete
MSKVIEIEKLTRKYGSGVGEVVAINEISLNIEYGEFTAIIGPSGSGKSTLLNLIGGLDKSDSGCVLLAGKDIAKMSGSQMSDFRRDRIGFIFQAYNLIPVLSATENIEYIMLLQGIPSVKRKERVQEMLFLVGLEGLGHRRPSELSGGQQQRVAVARAMASKPEIILADEPTANLDSKTGMALLDMMRQLNEDQGVTFVFSTHDEMIMKRARRLIHLRDGLVALDERNSNATP